MFVVYFTEYISRSLMIGFFYIHFDQIGGELMKKFVAVALACAGAVLICAGLKAAGKEA